MSLYPGQPGQFGRQPISLSGLERLADIASDGVEDNGGSDQDIITVSSGAMSNPVELVLARLTDGGDDGLYSWTELQGNAEGDDLDFDTEPRSGTNSALEINGNTSVPTVASVGTEGAAVVILFPASGQGGRTYHFSYPATTTPGTDEDGGTTEPGTITYTGTVIYTGATINVSTSSTFNITTNQTFTYTGGGFVIFEAPAKFKNDVWLDYHSITLSEPTVVTGLATNAKAVIRITPLDPLSVLAGMQVHEDTGTGRLFLLLNVHATRLLYITNEDAGELVPSRRFLTPDGITIVLRGGAGATVWYDPVSQRHRVLGYCCEPTTEEEDALAVAGNGLGAIAQIPRVLAGGLIGAAVSGPIGGGMAETGGPITSTGYGVARPGIWGNGSAAISGPVVTAGYAVIRPGIWGNGSGVIGGPIATSGSGAISDAPPCSTSNTYTVTVAGVGGGGSCASANGVYALTHSSGQIWTGVVGSYTATLDLATSPPQLTIENSGFASAIYQVSGTFSCATISTFNRTATTGPCTGWPASLTVTNP